MARISLVVPQTFPGGQVESGLEWGIVPLSAFGSGERRMEAECYLMDGFGLRAAIQARRTGWSAFASRTTVWQPPRLKGIQVASSEGTPFLTASQVFDVRPAPRKWLAASHTPDFERRFAASGLILVTCSGNVGKTTHASKAHAGKLISHDLLRVEATSDDWSGWVFSYLRAEHTRRMMVAERYGHIIKHLEPEHLERLPLLLPRVQVLGKFKEWFRSLRGLRDEACDLSTEAEADYASHFGSVETPSPLGFSVPTARMASGRLRLDAAPYSPDVDALRAVLAQGARRIDRLHQLVTRIFVPGRFKHVYGPGGVPYVDSADILEVCPEPEKFVLSLTAEELPEYRVEYGWLLVPCSGQIYGNLGQVALATRWHENKVLSNHILRILPRGDRIHRGYLTCALGHLSLGRPLLTSQAFGSSVPELAPADIAEVPVPRLRDSAELAIGDKMERVADLRGEADVLEARMAAEADRLVAQFLAGDPDHQFQEHPAPH